MENIKIRKCDLDDIEDLEKVDKLCFPTAHYPRFVLRQYFDLFPDLFLSAIFKDEIIAYVAGGLDSKQRGWALSLAVHPSHRSKGIGKSLMKSLIEKFKGLNKITIVLTVNPENKPAQVVCKNLGFKIVGTEANYFGDGDPRSIMELQL